MRHHFNVLPIAMLCLVLSAPSSAATNTSTHEWFSMTIEMRGLPEGAQGVPLSTPVDFSQALRDTNIPGTVDEKSLRLFRLAPSADEVEVPMQFTSWPQPRLKERPLLPGTPPTISHLGEYRPDGVPKEIRVAGQLCWVADGPTDSVCRYRLEFGVLRRGSFLQVPFPPQNLEAFDAEGRATRLRWFPDMQIRPLQPLDGGLDILENRQLVTRYHVGPPKGAAGTTKPSIRRPFLYPVNGPDGIGLTDFGKPHDPTGSHAHHYSIWIAHANAGAHDFWSEKDGLIAHESFELLEDGPVFCRMVQKLTWLVPSTSAKEEALQLLTERRTLTFYRGRADFRLIDVEMELAPTGRQGVPFGQTNFGFLAVRVAQSMTVFDGGGEILNSRGDRNEREAHEQQADWIDQSGPVSENGWGGIAIFDHPDNPRHPTYWHCRNDGWAGAAFNLKEGYKVEIEEPLHLKYRLCLHRHDAARGNVAQRYAEYAARPEVHLGPAAALK
jgi:hypothetical protein